MGATRRAAAVHPGRRLPYQQRLLACEDRLAAALRRRAAAPLRASAAADSAALERGAAGSGPRPTDEQAAAVRAALQRRLACHHRRSRHGQDHDRAGARARAGCGWACPPRRALAAPDRQGGQPPGGGDPGLAGASPRRGPATPRTAAAERRRPAAETLHRLLGFAAPG